MNDKNHSPVVAYALATSALLLAALLMCLCLLCCAKWYHPDWRQARRIKTRRDRLLKCCKKIKYRLKAVDPELAVSESCAVCLDDFEENESILLCPCSCKHGYHKNCIGDWLIDTPLCPICKKAVLPPSTERTPLLLTNS